MYLNNNLKICIVPWGHDEYVDISQNMVCVASSSSYTLSQIIYNPLPRFIYDKANGDLVHWSVNILLSIMYHNCKYLWNWLCSASAQPVLVRVQLLVYHVVLSSLLPCLHRAWSKLGCGWLWISPNHTLTTRYCTSAKSHDLPKPIRCELWGLL